MKAAALVVLLAGLLGLFSAWMTRELPVEPQDLSGRVYVLTGASSGIGAETTRVLADWGARVVVGVRNEAKMAPIAESIGGDAVRVLPLDLGSLASTRAFAAAVLASEPRIDGLICNAGFMQPIAGPMAVTEDGMESMLQTNYVGHWLLTELLLPRLEASAPARVVHVSSMAHVGGALDLEDLNGARLNPVSANMKQYGNTKLFQLLHSNELDRRLRARGSGVTSNALHPGSINTGFLRAFPDWLHAVGGRLMPFFLRSAREGAMTTVYAVTAPELEGRGGLYLEDAHVSAPRATALDEEAAAALWEATARLVSER